VSLFVARTEYSRAELLSDAVVHLAALLAALVAVPVLITLAAVWHGNAGTLTAVSVYGATLVAMIFCSLLYNHLPRPDWRDWLRRLDHSAIYLKIAGTYTPFAVLTGAGTGLLAGLWGAAVAGTGYAMLRGGRSAGVGILLCLGMGWAVLFGGGDILAQLPAPVTALMIAGGILYTMGTLFLVAGGMKFHNTIWHVFVMSASLVFFIAIMMQMVHSAPGT
jgi:hemolysin III